MKIPLHYGKDFLHLEIDAPHVTVIEPKFIAGLPDEWAAFQQAVRTPINCQPLREQIKATDKVAVVIPDITRP